MIENKNQLFVNIKNAGLYFLGSIVQSLFALIAQPIYSIHLTAAEFGILGYFDAIKSIFTPIFILSMTSIYLMRYFKQTEEENKKQLFNITFFLLLINTVSIFIGYSFIYMYFKTIGVEIPLNPFAWFVLISLLLNNLKNIVLINFRIRKKAMAYFVYSLISTTLNVGIGLLFVAIFKWGAEGRMFAPIISLLIIMPYSIIILKRYTLFHIDFSLFKRELRLAFPLILAAYAYVPVNNIDRFFLERLNDLSEFGLYNVGLTIAGYIQLGYVALALAFEPDIFKSVAERNYKKLMKLFALMFIPYFISVLLFMLMSGKVIYLLTAGRYMGAQVYTNIAVFGVFLMGVFMFFDKIITAMEKTKLNLLTNLTGGISSVAIMYFSVQTYGFIGAAYGKIFIALVLIIMSSSIVYKQIKSPSQNKL